MQPRFGYRNECTAGRCGHHFSTITNILNCLTLFLGISNSDKCTQNEHDLCEGVIKTIIDGSDNTEMCDCKCHDSSYQLVKKMFGLANQKD
jgi:hypothetical protein